MLVLEDPGGEPLERLVGRPMELRQFLRLAIGLSVALGRVQQRGLIHKDIKPANALVNAASGQVWLTGFGIASRLPRERSKGVPIPVSAIMQKLLAKTAEERYQAAAGLEADLCARCARQARKRTAARARATIQAGLCV